MGPQIPAQRATQERVCDLGRFEITPGVENLCRCFPDEWQQPARVASGEG